MVLKKLLPHQSAFIQAPTVYPNIRFIMLICGYGAGKTSSLVDSLTYWIDRLQGKRDREGRKPMIALCSSTLTFMKRTCVHDLQQALDNTNTEYTFHKDINQIEVGDVTIVLQPVETPEDIFGINVSMIFWDEADELDTTIMMEAMRSLNERLRQQLIGERSPFMMLTSTAQGKKGLYNTVVNFKQTGIPYMIIRGRTKDNIYLPKEYINAMYAMYTDKERECYLEGKFVAVDSNMVFPSYDAAVNDLTVDVWDSPSIVGPDTPIYIGQDFNSGFNNACAFIVINGYIMAIKDYEFPDVTEAPRVFRSDFPTNPIFWVPDMTYKEHFGSFKKEMKMYKIKIVLKCSNPNVNDRLFAVNKALKLGKLLVAPCCERLKKAFTTHQRDPKTGKPKKGGITAPDHQSDCVSYVVHALISSLPQLKYLYDYTLGFLYRHKDDASLRKGMITVDADHMEAEIKEIKTA